MAIAIVIINITISETITITITITIPSGIYLHKVDNENTITTCESLQSQQQ